MWACVHICSQCWDPIRPDLCRPMHAAAVSESHVWHVTSAYGRSSPGVLCPLCLLQSICSWVLREGTNWRHSHLGRVFPGLSPTPYFPVVGFCICFQLVQEEASLVMTREDKYEHENVTSNHFITSRTVIFGFTYINLGAFFKPVF